MTAPNAPMSNDEILSVLKKAASKLEAKTATVVFVGGNVGFETQCNDYGLMRVHAAVAAMAEREAAQAERVKALEDAFAKQGIGARESSQAAHDARIELTTAKARIAELEAEVEALRADAERYRYVRRPKAWRANYIRKVGGISAVFVSDGSVGHAKDGDELDAAIDAARADAGHG